MSPWFTLIIFIFLLHTALRILGHLLQRLGRRETSLATISTQWSSILPRYRHLLTNLGVGLGIFLFLIPFHHKPWLMEIEDASMDWVMQIRQAIIPNPQDQKELPAFVLLDIDDDTYQDWKEPLFTPRDRLKNLLEAAVKAQPRLIVVDIDVSQKMPLAGLEQLTLGLSLHPHDQALRDYFQKYVATCQAPTTEKVTCPPIILARAFRETPDQLPLHLRPSFLEETVTNSAPYVQWASTLFSRSADYFVRRWWLWQPACDDKQQPQVVPSVELLAVALIVNGISKNSPTQLATALQPFQPKDCQHALAPPIPQTIQIGELTVSAGLQDIRQRIVYSLPWQPKKPSSGDLRYTLSDQQGNTKLTVFSAKNFAISPPNPALLETAKDQVVIIGGSYGEGRDIHATPLGEMPGMLILTNAIYSLLQHEKEELDSLAEWQKLLVEAILIAIMSFAFAYWDSFWAMLFSAIFILVVLLPASIALFRYGVWLDFAVPLLTVYLHNLAAEFEKLQEPSG